MATEVSNRVIRDVAAKRYAEAAYLIARRDGTESAWLEGLTALAALSDDRVQSFLQDSRVPPQRKAEILETALKDVDPLVLNLGRMLLRRRKTAIAVQIKDAFQELVDQARGIIHATVISAVPLSEDELNAVRDKLASLTGGAVIVKPEVDESILGGLIVKMGDRLIDGSTRSRLQALKKELAGVER